MLTVLVEQNHSLQREIPLRRCFGKLGKRLVTNCQKTQTSVMPLNSVHLCSTQYVDIRSRNWFSLQPETFPLWWKNFHRRSPRRTSGNLFKVLDPFLI